VTYSPNIGRLPQGSALRDEAGEVTGYRKAHVRLFGGYDSAKAGRDPWPTGGTRPPTKWSIERVPHPFDIESWSFA